VHSLIGPLEQVREDDSKQSEKISEELQVIITLYIPHRHINLNINNGQLMI